MTQHGAGQHSFYVARQFFFLHKKVPEAHPGKDAAGHLTRLPEFQSNDSQTGLNEQPRFVRVRHIGGSTRSSPPGGLRIALCRKERGVFLVFFYVFRRVLPQEGGARPRVGPRL